MRIGIDIKTLNKHQSGIPMYLRNMLDKLQEIDTYNDYVLYSPKPVSYDIVNPRWQLKIVSSALPGTIWMQVYLPHILKRDKIDIFWSPEQVCPFDKPEGKAFITTIHDFTFLRFPKTLKWSTRTILSFTNRKTLELSDRLIPVSDFIKRETTTLLDKFNIDRSKTVTIPNAAPSWRPPADYSIAARENFLLFIGNIEPRKNLLRLIKALEILHKQGLSLTLKVVSAAAWKNHELYAVLKNSPVRSNIQWLGFVSTDEVKRLLLTCKSLVFPSIYEGFGLPVVEALALDCLVITSSGTAMQEVAGEAACYADPLSPDDIALKISSIYRPEFDRSDYLRHAHEVVDKYTWEASARKLLDLFTTLRK